MVLPRATPGKLTLKSSLLSEPESSCVHLLLLSLSSATEDAGPLLQEAENELSSMGGEGHSFASSCKASVEEESTSSSSSSFILRRSGRGEFVCIDLAE